ncbi:hypothetical protein RND81_09G174700 [Saponaria officinalis]|uniref:non-specific serine/threonine protein kinase n=1 Tax=Saponaria officinalis TaxID=3572 RepID=A0AAW1INX7_SAPOF
MAENPVIQTLNSTTFLGLKLYIIILLFIGFFSFSCFLLCFCLIKRKNKVGSKNNMFLTHNSGIIPFISEKNDINMKKIGEILKGNEIEEIGILIHGKKGEMMSGSGESSSDACSSSKLSVGSSSTAAAAEAANIGWGRWYGLRELEMATRGFCEENVIGEGGYGVVYKGFLEDGSIVAVKNLLNNKGQAEKEFKVEVEAIGKVRHKNLVGLLGYCADGVQRMLVYEFVDNGNLEQWLHGDVGPVSPLTWDVRMKIAVGTAKGLAYLHEGLEPKVVHRDVKSSNILLDKNWNAKVSDFGLAKLLGPEASYVTTRVMGTFGYVSPEYASTGMLSEGSDVYSFGVLLMELITGKCPVDYSKPPGEMNLVDWFKGMVANRNGEEMVDPTIAEKPSSRALKRVLLICLRCIDLDVSKRPKMGQIVHMLEADEFPFRSDHRSTIRPLGPATNKIGYPIKDIAR